MKKALLYIWELLKIFIVALIIVIPIRYFLFQPFVVQGDSMVPNFHSGDYLIIDELSYRFGPVNRGDIIVFKFPLNTSQRFIKRVIGLPGETVDVNGGLVTITDKNNKKEILDEAKYLPNAKEITTGSAHIALEDGEYFVMGDNRQYSYDSRAWGSLPESDIIGKVFIRVFPLASFEKIPVLSY
jgi:signal peptidase I